MLPALRRMFREGWRPDVELSEDEWRRLPPIGEVYERASPPVWTTRPPDWPGTYWVNLPGVGEAIVEVYAKRVGSEQEFWFRWSDIADTRVPDAGLEWSSREIERPLRR